MHKERQRLRCAALRAGSIKIDGIAVEGIGLFDLRSKLSLVPQDPVIFTGTVRSNLDPCGAFGSDMEAWNTIRQAGLEETIKSMPVRPLLGPCPRVTSCRLPGFLAYKTCLVFYATELASTIKSVPVCPLLGHCLSLLSLVACLVFYPTDVEAACEAAHRVSHTAFCSILLVPSGRLPAIACANSLPTASYADCGAFPSRWASLQLL